LSVFSSDRAGWENLMKRDMEQNFSWGVSAGKYEELYRSLLEK
jgi:glycogen synthase